MIKTATTVVHMGKFFEVRIYRSINGTFQSLTLYRQPRTPEDFREAASEIHRLSALIWPKYADAANSHTSFNLED
jgi:hypothetical protein